LSLGLFAQGEPLPKDTTVRVGKLANGLTYYIRYNSVGTKKTSFYIVQKVGSMQEEDNQKGLAHFLEHMALNGTKHFPGKRIVNLLAENGVNFQNDCKAITDFDCTYYQLNEIPTSQKPWLVDSCLLILSDWSHRLTLDHKEIDNERGVIHSEWRMTTDANRRMLERSLPRLYPNSKYAHRMPIGDMDVVDHCPYDALKQYYDTWYYPHNQAIVVVGCIDVDETEAKIKKYFETINTPADAPKAHLFPVPDNDKPIFVSDRDREQPQDLVHLMFKFGITDDTLKNFLPYFAEKMFGNMIVTMADARFDELMHKADAPFSEAGAGIDKYLISRSKNALTLYAKARENRMYECIQTLMREALRIRQFGFLESELDRAKKTIFADIERRFNIRYILENQYYADKCMSNFLDGEPLMSIEDEYRITDIILPQITIEHVNEYAKYLIPDDCKNTVCWATLTEKDGAKYITEPEMQDAVIKANNENINPYTDDFDNSPLITKEPKGGTIKSSGNGIFDSKYWILSNGAKVIYKPTTLTPELYFAAICPGGTSLFEVDRNNLANIRLFGEMVEAHGLGNFTLRGLQKKLTGTNTEFYTRAVLRMHNMSGRIADIRHLETLLQMMYLSFTDVNRDEADYQSFIEHVKDVYKNYGTNPLQFLNDTLVYMLCDGNIRNLPLSLDLLQKADHNEMLDLYQKLYSDPASFTYIFVGNINEEQLKTLVCKYLGGFKKSSAKPHYIKGRLNFHSGKKNVVFKRKMESPQSIVFAYLYHETDYNAKNLAIAQIAAAILKDKFFNVIREEKGIAYEAGANCLFDYSEKEGKATDLMTFIAYVKPETAQETQEVMYQIVSDFAENGFDTSSMENAKEYLVKAHQNNLTENRYWIELMMNTILYKSDAHTGYEEAVKSVTTDDVRKYFKTLLTGNQINVIMLPE
jgi:zinc protease